MLVNPFSSGAPNLTASAVALGGAMSWGCASAYAKHAPDPDQPLLGSGMQLLCAGAALCAVGAAGGELARIHASSLASASGLALGYLIIFGSLAAYSSYEWLIRHVPSPLAGTYAFVNPVVAGLLGWWLLAEHITGRTLLAAAVTVAGVILLVLPARQRRPARHTRPPAPGAVITSARGCQPTGHDPAPAHTDAAPAALPHCARIAPLSGPGHARRVWP